MKRVIWKEGDLVNLKLREAMYTIGQMLRDPYMQFFMIYNDSGDWHNIDLRNVEKLFVVKIARNFLRERGVQKIKREVIPADHITIPDFWIRMSLNQRGGDLVQFDPVRGDRGFQNAVIKKGIQPSDRETLLNYEMSNLYGEDTLTKRLIISLEANRNIDPLKQKIFPEAEFLK